MRRFLAGWAFLGAVLLALPAGAQLAKTRHNLSATGPGTVKAPGVQELCVFCHIPHRAEAARALWNRNLKPTVYNLYASSTLEAKLKQPTGASRLCLSCHDGTTALGNFRVSPVAQRMQLGPLKGRSSLGTDLSDDHPISFVYDSALAQRQGQLADPAELPKELPLDPTRQLQCTTCHDPHSSTNRKFLRKDEPGAALCTACHRQRNWMGSAHATSQASWRGSGANPWGDLPRTTVAQYGCIGCHRSHAAPHPARLLRDAQERAVCLVCHNGAAAAKNLETEFSKTSVHPVHATNWTHDPRENPNTMSRHVTCVDCHNPHQASAGPASAPAVPGPMWGVPGVNVSGAATGSASNEYEVCLKCHGITDQTTTGRVARQDNTRNIRLKINPSNPSFHPVVAVGKNTTMEGFEPNYSRASILFCTDCHNNDEWTLNGSRPRGPHGSRYVPILEREYRVNDPSAESFQTYALCYKCHNRNYLINDRANTFKHKKHIVKENAPCAVCHDAHGSRRSVGLINFMLRDRTGKTVVSPSRNQGRLEFVSLGRGRGQCYLQCHGKNHEPLTYP